MGAEYFTQPLEGHRMAFLFVWLPVGVVPFHGWFGTHKAKANPMRQADARNVVCAGTVQFLDNSPSPHARGLQAGSLVQTAGKQWAAGRTC